MLANGISCEYRQQAPLSDAGGLLKQVTIDDHAGGLDTACYSACDYHHMYRLAPSRFVLDYYILSGNC